MKVHLHPFIDTAPLAETVTMMTGQAPCTCIVWGNCSSLFFILSFVFILNHLLMKVLFVALKEFKTLSAHTGTHRQYELSGRGGWWRRLWTAHCWEPLLFPFIQGNLKFKWRNLICDAKFIVIELYIFWNFNIYLCFVCRFAVLLKDWMWKMVVVQAFPLQDFLVHLVLTLAHARFLQCFPQQCWAGDLHLSLCPGEWWIEFFFLLSLFENFNNSFK